MLTHSKLIALLNYLTLAVSAAPGVQPTPDAGTIFSVYAGTWSIQARRPPSVSLNWHACSRAAQVGSWASHPRFFWLRYPIYRCRLCRLCLRSFRVSWNHDWLSLRPQDCNRSHHLPDSGLRCQCRPQGGLWDVSSSVFLLLLILD